MNPAISQFDPLNLLPESDLVVLSDEQKKKLSRDLQYKLGEFIIVSFSDDLSKYELEDVLDTVGMERQIKKIEEYVPAFPHKVARVIDEFGVQFKKNYNQ